MGKKVTKQEILDYLASIKESLQEDGICKLGLFGSYARDEANENSDIDITLETSDEFVNRFIGLKAFGYLGDLRRNISNQFGLEVDICDTASMSKERQTKLLRGVIYV